MTASTLLQRLFSFRPAPATPLAPPGLHHFLREADGAVTRFHLRVERDGSGLLLANASLAARLSPAGVFIARALLAGEAEAEVLKRAGESFRGATPAAMRADIARVKAILENLAAPGDNYPILNLDDAAFSPNPADLIAPLNVDLPLAAPPSGEREALRASPTRASLAPTPEQMTLLIARLWEIGIPHLTVFAPENSDAGHLVRAVERAEDTGLICGVRGRASDLRAGTLLKDLAQAGLDHLNIFYAAAQPEQHDSLFGDGDHAAARDVLQRAQELEVCPVAEVLLVEANLRELDETLAALNALGVTNAAFYALAEIEETADGALSANALPQAAARVEDAANANAVRYIWQPPVRRNPALTLAAQARLGPRCSGDVSVRVEPDGRVIPPRGPARSAGNLLTDPWDVIWNHAEFRRYRERVLAPTHCDACPGLAICAADCPREPASWSEGN